MITRKIEFETLQGAVVYLVGQDFRQDDAGNWRRFDDGATAVIERLSFAVQVRIRAPARPPPPPLPARPPPERR